jgi:hypothetical protein
MENMAPELVNVISPKQCLEDCIDHLEDAPSKTLKVQSERFAKIFASHYQDRCIFQIQAAR